MAKALRGLRTKLIANTWQFIKGAALSSLLSIGSELASDAYGEKVDISALISSMLTSFLAGDAGFKKAKRELA